MWASIRPGMSVRPPASSTRAPDALIGRSETSRIRPSATRTFMPSGQFASVPSKMRALVKSNAVTLGASRWSGRISQHLPIDEESRTLGNPVVELHRGRVGLVGLPVDARRACVPCAIVDRLDERARDPLPRAGPTGEQAR